MIDEPTQSDATLLLKVEDLIHLAMGPNDQNVVNFKLLQTILYILARQMRLLDQKVELKQSGDRREEYSETVTEEVRMLTLNRRIKKVVESQLIEKTKKKKDVGKNGANPPTKRLQKREEKALIEKDPRAKEKEAGEKMKVLKVEREKGVAMMMRVMKVEGRKKEVEEEMTKALKVQEREVGVMTMRAMKVEERVRDVGEETMKAPRVHEKEVEGEMTKVLKGEEKVREVEEETKVLRVHGKAVGAVEEMTKARGEKVKVVGELEEMTKVPKAEEKVAEEVDETKKVLRAEEKLAKAVEKMMRALKAEEKEEKVVKETKRVKRAEEKVVEVVEEMTRVLKVEERVAGVVADMSKMRAQKVKVKVAVQRAEEKGVKVPGDGEKEAEEEMKVMRREEVEKIEGEIGDGKEIGMTVGEGEVKAEKGEVKTGKEALRAEVRKKPVKVDGMKMMMVVEREKLLEVKAGLEKVLEEREKAEKVLEEAGKERTNVGERVGKAEGEEEEGRGRTRKMTKGAVEEADEAREVWEAREKDRLVSMIKVKLAIGMTREEGGREDLVEREREVLGEAKQVQEQEGLVLNLLDPALLCQRSKPPKASELCLMKLYQIIVFLAEKFRDKDKVLAGPGPMRVGSVEVVTQKEFLTLANAVKALQEKAGPLPTPTLPDNKKLRDDIVKGSASLMDTMQAMRLSARVQAAEKAIDTMADLLTHLASQGVLPPEVARAAEQLHDEVIAVRREIESVSGKGGDADKKGVKLKGMESKTGAGASPSAVSTVSGGTAATGPGSRFGRAGGGRLSVDSRAGVAHGELDEALRQMKEDIMQNMSAMMNRATSAADAAALHVKSISEKMEVATKLDHRVSTLHSLVNDYAEQLSGFDHGLSTQMAGFHEQMAQMRTDMTCGLQQLEQVNNNAETAAVLELTERYEGLVSELDSTLHAHQGLTTYQRELSDELRSLVEAVEMMREQKADRDEVQDGLRDKADSSRLAGLLTDEQFTRARESLEVRMEMCYDKFRKQDLVWMDVVRDFARVSETKAELMQLLSIREEAQQELRELNCKVKQLAKMLGDPKAAIITRKLAKDATCAVCRVPALMEPQEPVQPFSLPYARPPPAGAAAPGEDEEECLKEVLEAEADEAEQPSHYCRRWVGGSHTLIGHAPGLGSVSKKKARGFPFSHPSKKYLGYGNDGKLYKLEDVELTVPCGPCNEEPKDLEVVEEKIPGETDTGQDAGEGAQMSRRVTLVDASTARRVTVVDDGELKEALEAEVALASPGGSRRPTVTEPGIQRPHLSEAPRNSLEEESVRAPSGSTSRTGTDVTEVAVRDITEAAARPSVVIDLPGDRRATIVGDVDTFPSLGTRVSTMTRASAIAVAQMSRRGTEVGTTIQGHVTTMGVDEAEREAIIKQIAEDKAESQARAEGAAGGGTPVEPQETKEEEKEEAK
ncbi:uncharacterized protein LOC126373487 [Pectinophora gossypiella]|uniref:uncharacterized protein LOC126373487 n=1 Tax=Pectinophora gossypiella TaxID=13191 RepID=UPI00214EA2DC|nr:uncharacterized protein LOC126373487 [Pectinophora gossypiella]